MWSIGVIVALIIVLVLFYYAHFGKKENFYLLNQYNQTRSDPAADNNIYTFRGHNMGIESPTFDIREKELQKLGYRDHI
jgi:hypothetical protein